MKEQKRLLDIKKRADRLSEFCNEVNKVIFLKTVPPPHKK